ncbi:hypothetical protein CVU75_03860 [Candidatus Dependentiae bacterium HGW-Dependentiae-1]|nr:MAG: hypothetical protein CVU75_03860 [Candidatus Dependentiae bacterium HGW-Dependentiae-1]
MPYNYQSDTHSLYLHWPFCPYRCRFCPFVALSGHDDHMQSYHGALNKEIELFVRNYTGNKVLRTMYLGGGTPSTWPAPLLLDTLSILKDVFVFDQANEVTIEVNPGTVAKEQPAIWREAGITRVSVGVQSLNDQVLRSLGRYQTAADVYQLIPRLADHFVDISIDLIIGLPGVSLEEWKQQLQRIVTWPITHLSLYFLSVDPFTRLESDVRAGRCTVPGEQEVLAVYYWSIDFLKQQGFQQYEISNFARPGHESKHNQAYWERKSYKGFGLGAWSFDGTSRYQNHKSLLPYIQGIQRGDDITYVEELLTSEQVRLEKIMLGLRHMRGVSLLDVFANRSAAQHNLIQETITRLVHEQLLVSRDGRLFLTPAGLAVENAIAVELSA